MSGPVSTASLRSRSLARSLLGCCVLAGAFVASGVAHCQTAAAPKATRVLVFSKTLGYRHASIADGIVAIRELAAQRNVVVEATEDSAAFTAANLARFQAVVLLSVTGDVFDSAQEEAFKAFVLNGGGVAAIHGALFGPKACEENWTWLGEAMCAAFVNHSKVVPAIVVIEDKKNPSTIGLPAKWERTDEWYNYKGSPRGCAHVLATLDESTYEGGTHGADHPIAWCRQIGKGRLWYTAMGHTPSSFSEPHFRQHLLGGILLAAGIESGDFSANAPLPPAKT